MDDKPRRDRQYRGILGPIVLLVVGVVLLLEKTGVIQRDMLWQWWPLLLILIGGWLLVTRINRNND
jgi:hypothetical protein